MAAFSGFGSGFLSGLGGVESIRLNTSSGAGAGGSGSGFCMEQSSYLENDMRR